VRSVREADCLNIDRGSPYLAGGMDFTGDGTPSGRASRPMVSNRSDTTLTQHEDSLRGPPPAQAGSSTCIVRPWSSLRVAQIRPPCASMIERLIARSMPGTAAPIDIEH
jgi:hypothetical protein